MSYVVLTCTIPLNDRNTNNQSLTDAKTLAEAKITNITIQTWSNKAGYQWFTSQYFKVTRAIARFEMLKGDYR